MKELRISEDLVLPLKTVTEKLAWLGRTGSGKTYGAMKLAELMLAAGAQVGAIDPVGVWRALRVPAKKGGTSFEVVVFGGLYGDLPLEPTAGVLIADLVCDRGFSFVLDVSQFIPSEQQRFVHAFADRFFHRKKAAPGAVHLFMEECQEFIPENPSGLEAMTLGVMQRLWKLGRNFGIGGSLISQRPQEIAKKALNMSGTLFAFQMTGPQERKAIKSWVADKGIAVDIESVLQKLEVGQPHVESPMFLEISKTIRILPRVTADLSSTPEVGVSTAAARSLTPIDIEQLKTSMAATIEKAKAEDPALLRKRIAELERELKKAPAAAPATAPRTVEKPVLQAALVKRLEDAAARVDRSMVQLGKWAQAFTGTEREVRNVGADILAALAAARSTRSAGSDVAQAGSAPRARMAVGVGRPAEASRPAPVVAQTPAAQRAASAGLEANEQRTLDTVAMLYQRGLPVTREAVARWQGLHPNGGRFNRGLARLREAGYLDGFRLTERGEAAARPLETGSAFLLAALPDEGHRRVMGEIFAAGAPLSREDLAQRLNLHPNGGRYNRMLAWLRDMGVIPERGSIEPTAGAHR